jgi:hypothetical protein
VSVALGIQQAMRMRCIVICGLLGCSIFFHIISQMAGFSKGIIEHKICALRPVILVRFKLNFKFIDRLSKNNEIPNFMKIVQ